MAEDRVGDVGPARRPADLGALEFDATPMQELIEKARVAGTGSPSRISSADPSRSPSPRFPTSNVRIHGSKMVPRESVDIFYITPSKADVRCPA